MGRYLWISVVLFCSVVVLAAPQVEESWFFPDQLVTKAGFNLGQERRISQPLYLIGEDIYFVSNKFMLLPHCGNGAGPVTGTLWLKGALLIPYYKIFVDREPQRPIGFDFFRPAAEPGPGGKTASSSTTTPSPDVLFQLPGCPCPFPSQYNPVCGTDGLSYLNAQFLKCARRCGKDVSIRRIGACKVRFSVSRK